MSPDNTLKIFDKDEVIPKNWNKLPSELHKQALEIIEWNREVEKKKKLKKDGKDNKPTTVG